MGEQTKIQWCHHTFNPWLGCSKVHSGCASCYAEHALPVAMRPGGKLQWGEVWQGGQRVVKADSGWKEPLKWAREAARDGVRRRVFCASLADVLEVPTVPGHLQAGTSAWNDAMSRVEPVAQALDAARARLWETIRQTAALTKRWLPRTGDGFHPVPADQRHQAMRDGAPGLDWLLLTKRPEHWALVPEDVRPLAWLGTSISDKETADEWVPRLLDARGFRLRFLSLEPMVNAVDLGLMGTVPADISPSYRPVASMIDWVIVGGESGSKARPLNVAWVRSIVEQCREAGVPCFVKQLGSAPATAIAPTGNFRTNPETGRRQLELAVTPLDLADSKGGDMAEWPEDIRVREVPHA